MAGKFHHERIYRGDDAMAKLSRARVAVCGAGALGSHVADALARLGVTGLRAIDFDRVEEHNVSTQLYDEAEVGLFKVEALRSRLFRATGVEVDARQPIAPGIVGGAGTRGQEQLSENRQQRPEKRTRMNKAHLHPLGFRSAGTCHRFWILRSALVQKS